MQLFGFRIELGTEGCDLCFKGLRFALLLAEPAIRFRGLLVQRPFPRLPGCPGTAGQCSPEPV